MLGGTGVISLSPSARSPVVGAPPHRLCRFRAPAAARKRRSRVRMCRPLWSSQRGMHPFKPATRRWGHRMMDGGIPIRAHRSPYMRKAAPGVSRSGLWTAGTPYPEASPGATSAHCITRRHMCCALAANRLFTSSPLRISQ
ncbi:hypothetical protein HNR21_003901 [Actinomadura cellulosilytica]|uniref:Uncharacterized protein n=1 Tax=Thermomonospora cellulosilytica TaxID=1411118 RepID=A0A7W3N007_9ACTN|nr:hypothetical protein [Thermomonospora cellulosilytica]